MFKTNENESFVLKRINLEDGFNESNFSGLKDVIRQISETDNLIELNLSKIKIKDFDRGLQETLVKLFSTSVNLVYLKLNDCNLEPGFIK
jgi:hypothetical protein